MRETSVCKTGMIQGRGKRLQGEYALVEELQWTPDKEQERDTSVAKIYLV